MHTGISLYLGSGAEANQAVIEKAARAGMTYAFTSLQIPEEQIADYRSSTRELLEQCKAAGIHLIADISPHTLDKLGVERIEDLVDLGITHVRLDFGFSAEQTVALSSTFHVVFNASTISKDDIAAWRAAGADFSRFAACHNFYPKPLTGLSLKRVRAINQRLSFLGFQIMGFVPGDAQLRGPVHEGLPTVEEHRGHTGMQLVMDALDLRAVGCDVVLVGDPDLEPATWDAFSLLSKHIVPLPATVDKHFSFIADAPHTDRPDSSAYIVRSQESRRYAAEIPHLAQLTAELIPADKNLAPQVRPAGSITMATAEYGRYLGELEIARADLPADDKQVIIGTVDPAALPLVQRITDGLSWNFVLQNEDDA